MRRVCFIALLWCLLPLSVQAATYWVSPSLGGSGNCGNAVGATPPANYLRTLAAGIACMNSGDTLAIRSGTYRDYIGYQASMPPSGSAGSPTRLIRYSGDPSGSVVMAPTSGQTNTVVDFYNGGNANLPEYITFDGITLDGNDGIAPSPPNGPQPINAYCWRMESGRFNTFQNGEIRNCAIGIFPGNSNVVRNTHIHHHGTDTQFQHCFYGSGNSSTIENNEIDHCANYGIQYYNGSCTSCVYNNIFRNNNIHDTRSGVTIGGQNNQVYNNIVSRGAIALQYDGVSSAKVLSNTIIGNDCNAYAALQINEGVGHQVQNNLVYCTSGSLTLTNTCGGSCTVSNNLLTLADPGFVQAAQGNFHLLAGSPAIDAGVDLGDPYRVDIEGRTRSIPPDAGAYEFAPSEPPPQPPPPGLQVWLKADGNFLDSSGMGFHATGQNGATATGAPIIGTNAFALDGIDDYLSLPNTIAFRPADKLCLSLWTKGSASQYGYFWDVSSGYGLWHDPQGNAHGYILTASGLVGVQTTGVNVRDTMGHHLVFVKDALGLRLYDNNVPRGFTSTTAAIAYTGTPAPEIGRNSVNLAENFAGTIDAVRMYNDECTPDAVAQLYAEDVPLANTAMTHMQLAKANAAQTEANLVGIPDRDQAFVVTDVVDLLFTITRTGAQTVLHYPLECAINGGPFTAVTNSVGTLGVKIAANSVLNMGDSTPVPLPATLPIGGLSPVPGRVVADMYDPNVKTTLNNGEVTQWRYTVAFDVSRIGAAVQCRPGNVDSYTNIKTLSLLAPPSARDIRGGQYPGVTLQ